MSDSDKVMVTLLEVVRMANTGVLLWDVAGGLLQGAMERGENEVTLDDVEVASVQAGQDIGNLRAAIAAKRAL